jgi:uncharacterized repeat protein (TIGR03803 family)
MLFAGYEFSGSWASGIGRSPYGMLAFWLISKGDSAAIIRDDASLNAAPQSGALMEQGAARMKIPTSGGYALGICVAVVILAACSPSTISMPVESSNGTIAPFLLQRSAFVPPLSGPSTAFKVLYSFKASPDGANPLGGLVFDAKGALYGTTASGGSPFVCLPPNDTGCGTVFKLTPSGSGYVESVLYRFNGYQSSDGAWPMGRLVVDKEGAVYGATAYGNPIGRGVLFKLSPTTPSGYTESILHTFLDSPDGSNPMSGLASDKNGVLYGTTPYGGAERGCRELCDGCGTVFMISNSAVSILHSFCQRSRLGRDGANPFGGLIFDTKGALYGTTSTGGAHDFGTVFRFSRGFRVLCSFCAQFPCSSGATPEAGLIFDSKGALYGTTSSGGRRDNGTVFKLTPSGSGYTEISLHRFSGPPDGAHPVADLVFGTKGALYGTTSGGGTRYSGTVFKLTPSGSGYKERILHAFTGGADGGTPKAGLIFGRDGALYGTTEYGGTGGNGTVFEVTP